MRNRNKKEFQGLSLWWFITPCIILLALIVVSPITLSQNGPKWMDLSGDGAARIGDSIGGITAPFVGVLAVIVTFLAFWVQYEYNKRQLKFTIREQFNHSFYEMLGIHESITNALHLGITVAKQMQGNTIPNVTGEIRNGRNVFAYIYEELMVYEDEHGRMFSYEGKKQYTGIKGLFMARHDDAYPIYESNKYVSSLDHYFRQLYGLFKMIDKNEELNFDEKCNYASIIRSTLSQYELVLLFYNCLSGNGKDKFKPLIETYSVLKNIRKDLLADPDECNKYNGKAFDPEYMEQ